MVVCPPNLCICSDHSIPCRQRRSWKRNVLRQGHVTESSASDKVLSSCSVSGPGHIAVVKRPNPATQHVSGKSALLIQSRPRLSVAARLSRRAVVKLVDFALALRTLNLSPAGVEEVLRRE